MERVLGRYSPYLYALLRIVAGFLFFQHGLPKLFGGFGRDAPVELMSQMGLAGIIEVVGGALIAVGLFTSPVAFIASGEMAVAYFQAHAPRGFWPITNGGELAALYCFVFLMFAAVGGTRYSLDQLLHARRRTSTTRRTVVPEVPVHSAEVETPVVHSRTTRER
jgi:putative oxidoreductase